MRRWIALAALAAAGCGAPQLASEMAPGRSLVAVHVDMSKAPNPWMSALYLDCDSPGAKFTAQEMRRDQKTSLFYLENVPSGTCWLAGGWSPGNPSYTFTFTRDKRNATATRVGSGEFRYMGSFQYKARDENTFFVERVKQPAEKDILQRLQPIVEKTGWAEPVHRRLGAL